MIRRGQSHAGYLLLFLLPLAFLMVGVVLLLIDLSRYDYVESKARVVASTTLLSSLEMRQEGLAKMAGRWDTLRPFILEADEDGITVSRDSWPEFERQTQKLKRALPGYKGRIKAVIKVVADAQNSRREAVVVTEKAGSDMGIDLEALLVRDEEGRTQRVENVWLKRAWAPTDRLGEPREESEHRVRIPFDSLLVRFLGKSEFPAVVTVRARGRLRWDVDRTNPLIQTAGDGGYPRGWPEAVWGGKAEPFRYPFYWAELTTTGAFP